MSVRGLGGQEGHGGHQARAGHSPAGEGGDRGVEGVCGQAGGTHASEEASAPRTGLWLLGCRQFWFVFRERFFLF